MCPLGSLSGLTAVVATYFAFLSATPGITLAQASVPDKQRRDTIYINHAKRIATYKNSVIEDGAVIRTRRPYDVVIHVKNSNSAIYDCEVDATKTGTPEVQAILAFMKGLSPYLLEAASMVGGRTPKVFSQAEASGIFGTRGAKSDSTRILDALHQINGAISDADGLRALFARTIAELDSMRRLDLDKEFQLAAYNHFVDSACESSQGRCVRARAITRLTAALGVLGTLLPGFAQAVATDPSSTPREKRLVELGEAALAEADGLLNSAYLIEQIVLRTYKATRSLTCAQKITVSWNSGRDATITLSPTEIAEISRTGNAKPYTLKLGVHPDWIARPTIGLSFVAIPSARFQKFGTRKVSDTQHLIDTTGRTDARFSYGLTLATTWRGLDWRDTKVPIALYFPEATINPSDSERGFGLGAGFSLYNFKFTVGRSWTKHTFLADALSIGGQLTAPEELRTFEGYGHGRFYWSISLIGLPPFLPP